MERAMQVLVFSCALAAVTALAGCSGEAPQGIRAPARTQAIAAGANHGDSWDEPLPVGGSVLDGLTGPDIDYQSSTTTLAANWPGFEDPDWGIAGYEWAIGTTSGGTEVQAFTDVSTATSAIRNGLTLSTGTTYFVTVRAFNGLGEMSQVTSDGVLVDGTAPVAGTVNDGASTGIDIEFQSSTTTLSANWNGFGDAQSGIAGYEWAIG